MLTIKKEIDSNTIIVRNITPLTPMDKSSRQKIIKETQALDNTLDQLDLIDSYREFHPKTEISLSPQMHMELSAE